MQRLEVNERLTGWRTVRFLRLTLPCGVGVVCFSYGVKVEANCCITMRSEPYSEQESLLAVTERCYFLTV